MTSATAHPAPFRVIHRQGPTSLRWYQPADVREAPLFISMPLINRASIWDLLPGHSVLARLLDRGFPIALLDWGSPGPEQAHRPLATFVDEFLGRALDRTRREARKTLGSESIDAVGYCVGGTFLAMHLSRHDGVVRRLVAVASPFDFSKGGRLARWAGPQFPVDQMAGEWGNFPAERMRQSFQWLRPEGVVKTWTSLLERGSDPKFAAVWTALKQWNAEAVDFPGAAWADYVRACYQENQLMGGSYLLGGTPCDLGKATIPALALAASDDHIAPPDAVFGLAKRWGGPVTTRTLRGGHISISLGDALPAAIAGFLTQTSVHA